MTPDPPAVARGADERPVVLAIDIGGTTTSGGIVTDDGRVLAECQALTHERGPGSAQATIERVIDDLRTRAAGLDVVALGIGVPAVVDAAAGVVGDEAHHVPEFAGAPLASMLAVRAGVPVFIDNDVNALALGEWRFEAGPGAQSLVVLALGTGVGAGIVLDGRIVRGAHGFAAELGHIPIKFDGPACWCGGRGCLVLYASGRGIADAARAWAVARGRAGSADRIDAAGVFRLAAAGDADATAIVDEACQALGAMIGVVVNGLNPESIVITGGVAAAFVPLEARVRAAASAYAFQRALARTRVVITPGDKRSSMRGAAALAWYELEQRRLS